MVYTGLPLSWKLMYFFVNNCDDLGYTAPYCFEVS
jgi:hypothetical protein